MKQKPILNESTVRKFMKLANLGKVGEGFIAEAYGKEEQEDENLEEDKNFGGTAGHKMKPLKTSKKNIVKEAEEETMDEPSAEMPETPPVEPAEESDVDGQAVVNAILDALQGLGVIEVEGEEMDEPDMGDMGDEEEDEGMYEEEDEGMYEEEEDEGMYESKKRQVAKIVAERVMRRLQREQKVDTLAENITKRVMARMSGR